MWVIILIAILIIIIICTIRQNLYFRRSGIKSAIVYEPFLGEVLKILLKRKHFIDMFEEINTTFPNEKYFGNISFSQPAIVVVDAEIIHQICIKDFNHFVNRFDMIASSIDPVFGSMLPCLRGQKWRDMRATLSPAFTSSKMKNMFEFVNECGEQMVQYFLNEAKKPEYEDKKCMEVDLKDIFTRYTSDVIGTSAFGINVNSLQEKENYFYLMGKKALNFTGLQLIKMLMMMALPRLAKFFKLTVFSSSANIFFRDLVNSAIKLREEKGIVRNDMIQLLMEAKEGSLKHDTSKTDDKDAGFATVEESDVGKHNIKREWTDNELLAQAVIFFFAGFETAANLLSFMAYELAKNSDIQKRLQDEIDAMAEKIERKLKYEDLQHMKYLDMVVSETFRYWPPALVTDRKCVKPYTLPPSNDNNTTGGKVNVGDVISIPIYAIHHDPIYYKDPMKFDPERFSDENKHEINPLAFMPFGVGPRNCIGSRFALMEIKAAAFHLFRHFNVVVTEKTPIPMKFDFKNVFGLIPKEGLWLGLEPRDI